MLKKLLKSLRSGAAVLLASALLTSCSSIEYIEVPVIRKVQILEPPTAESIPAKLTPEQDEAIDQKTYEILTEREEYLLQHILRQNKIIQVNNDAADNSIEADN